MLTPLLPGPLTWVRSLKCFFEQDHIPARTPRSTDAIAGGPVLTLAPLPMRQPVPPAAGKPKKPLSGFVL